VDDVTGVLPRQGIWNRVAISTVGGRHAGHTKVRRRERGIRGVVRWMVVVAVVESGSSVDVPAVRWCPIGTCREVGALMGRRRRGLMHMGVGGVRGVVWSVG